MYVCHNYNLEVMKTRVVRFSARQLAYLIAQLVAFKKLFLIVPLIHNDLHVCDCATLQDSGRNVKSDLKSLLQETLHLLTSENQEVLEMDPEVRRVMVFQCTERQLV